MYNLVSVSVRLRSECSHGTGWDAVSKWLAQLAFLQHRALGSSAHRELLDVPAAGPDARRGVWVGTRLRARSPLCPFAHRAIFRHQAWSVKVGETPVGALTTSTHRNRYSGTSARRVVSSITLKPSTPGQTTNSDSGSSR